MSKTCVRCGINYKRLDKHLQKKKLCEAKYLDIDEDKILKNYNKYHKQFIEMKKKNNKSKCSYCDKSILSKNITRHIEQIHHIQSNQNNQNIQNIQTQINANQVNITNDNSNNVNISFTLNNFGNEKNIDINTAFEIFKNAALKDKDSEMDISAFMDYFKELHLDIKENRNVYNDRKGKYGYIFMNNKWKTTDKNDMRVLLLENTRKHMKNNFDLLNTTSIVNEINNSDNEEGFITNMNKIIHNTKDIIHVLENISMCYKNTYNEEWLEIIKRIDILLSDYNKELKEIYKLTQ